jgi:hypothetical protein
VAFLVAACGVATSTGTPQASAQAPTPVVTASGGATNPGGSASPGASSPADSPTPGASTQPTTSAGPSASSGASASTAPGGAEACSGSDANRAFFANFAHAVSWPVFCAVLPKGWFVTAGSNRLANGGRLVIAYKGPGGATLTLSEGSFCTSAAGCIPSVADGGSTPFGSRSGLLYDLSGSGGPAWTIVVDGGRTPMWTMETHGLDQPTTVALAAALATVNG